MRGEVEEKVYERSDAPIGMVRGACENTLVDFDPWTVFKDPAAGDWHLRKFCPAVDVVKVSADEAAGTDLDGNPRLIGMRLDLGCYEAPPVPGLMLMVR